MSGIPDKLRILLLLLRNAYSEWRTEIWPKDLDAPYCCDGRECGCYGSSLRDVYLWRETQ